MQTQNLEETIRDLAKRGELTHISLTPSQGGKKWRALFAPASTFGNSFAEDVDPVKAIQLACTSAKIRKHKPFKDGDGAKRKVDAIPQDDLEADDSADPLA